MTLWDAQSLLVNRRRDWNRGHLGWLPKSLYRSRLLGRRK